MNIKNSTLIRAIASCFLCSVFLALAVWTVSGSQRFTGATQRSSGANLRPSGTPCPLPSPSDAYQTTVQYVETFYPLWFTWKQAHKSNVLVGPERVSPLYHSVVMINDDTIYCSAFLNLDPNASPSPSPVMILTIPSTVPNTTCSQDTSVTYSILPLDPYGDVSPTPSPPIPDGSAPIPGGTYALTGPDYNGPIPEGAQQIRMPVNYPTIIFRADKYHSFASPSATPDYQNMINQADQFRLSLQLQTVDQYLECSHTGYAEVDREFPDFAIPYKTAADAEIAADPVRFLRELQKAVASPRTPPLSACNAALSLQFDNLFGNGHWGKNSPFGQGAQDAHSAIIENYVTNPAHQLPGNWTHFTNIGEWNGDILSDAIDRSSITEFCQFCNDISAAAYYHTFRDGAGQLLDGRNSRVYVLTFPAPTPPALYPGPETSRFWSLTAYTEQAIELIPNPINKYVVASYSGAHLNPNGSLSVVMAAERPEGVPFENWLPVANGPFNIVLRDYGPEGSVTTNNYTPPPIQLQP